MSARSACRLLSRSGHLEVSPNAAFCRLLARNRHRTGVRNAHQFTQKDLRELLPSRQDLGLWEGDNVTVAMSGGVDSSVALRILTDMPIEVNVVFMRNWDPLLSEEQDRPLSSPRPSLTNPTTEYVRTNPSGFGSDLPSDFSLSYPSSSSSSSSHIKSSGKQACAWEKDWEDVRAVCRHVGVSPDRIKLVDLSKEYWSKVFEPSVREWEAGRTPNPDILCNRHVKFGELMRHIPKGQRSFLATGHYSRVKRVPHATRLCRATDSGKDQTYYLSGLTRKQIERTILPLGAITKVWVRELAQHYGLPTADRAESMGICFVGERDNFGDFISQYTNPPASQGYLIDEEGKQLKAHNGPWYYTIGQGARIPGMADPMFVAKKGLGASGQDILVVPRSDHPKLQCTQISTENFHWIHEKVPKGIVPGGTKKASIQLRHRMDPIPGFVTHDWNGRGLTIDFPTPIHGIAPGQTATMFYEKWCLGSGIIKSTKTVDELPARQLRRTKGWEASEPGSDLPVESNKPVRRPGDPRAEVAQRKARERVVKQEMEVVIRKGVKEAEGKELEGFA